MTFLTLTFIQSNMPLVTLYFAIVGVTVAAAAARSKAPAA